MFASYIHLILSPTALSIFSLCFMFTLESFPRTSAPLIRIESTPNSVAVSLLVQGGD